VRPPRGRRQFLATLAGAAGGALAPRAAPAIVRARPSVVAVASGDVDGSRAVVWAQADRAARMVVEYATGDSFRDLRRIVGPAAVAATDFTARVDLTGLPRGQRIVYRVVFQDLADPRAASEPSEGRFGAPPVARRDVSFVWGGDVAGQGWGIDRARGGMTIFEVMGRASPDLFIHSGDSIYADGPLKEEVVLADGTTWRNVVTPAKSKVAETLEEFRGNYRYNLLDDHYRSFRAAVPWVMQWDDHEVLNNWYPGEIHDDARYRLKDVTVLAARARRAFLEHAPLRFSPAEPARVYRAISYGPSLDVFVVDLRTYRAANSANRQPQLGAAARILGAAQLRWLKGALAASRATWKVIACDMPIGLAIPDGANSEAVANGDDGPPLGRELEIADLLRFIAARRVTNVVFVTADVHYAAAHHYHPDRARLAGFRPFWEFVAGPLHAGTFLPTPLDATFGPEVRFVAVPPDMKPNRPPSEGLQFFGEGRIDAATETLNVRIRDREGRVRWSVDLEPERA
jgi:alkaline phosphatase D